MRSDGLSHQRERDIFINDRFSGSLYRQLFHTHIAHGQPIRPFQIARILVRMEACSRNSSMPGRLQVLTGNDPSKKLRF